MQKKKYHKLYIEAVEYFPILLNLGLRQRFQHKVTQYKQKRFFNEEYIRKVSKYLKINNYSYLLISQSISYLKEAKEEYLAHKGEYRKIRDEYINKL